MTTSPKNSDMDVDFGEVEVEEKKPVAQDDVADVDLDASFDFSDGDSEPAPQNVGAMAQDAVDPAAVSGRVAELEAEVAALQAELSKMKDQALRSMADAENTRRRAIKEREDMSKYAVTNFARELTTVADNLRRAVDAVSEEDREVNKNVKNLIIGVEATERQLLAAFESQGIKKLEPMDEPFDPNIHRVMFEVDNTGKPAGTIVQLLQAGYMIHDRLLREAMVGVSKGEGNPEKVDTTA